MKNALYIRTHLDNLRAQMVPQAIEYTTIHNARINIVGWIYNGGNLQEERILKDKLQKINEEIIGYDFANDHGLMYKAALARKQELEAIME